MVGETVIDDTGQSYLLEREIGRGGFGIVYLSHDKEGQACAVKMLGPIVHTEYLESFKREITAAASVSDANVLRFIASGQYSNAAGTYFFTVAEYCPDGSYRPLISSRKEDINALISDFTQILSGLKALHQKVVHRDIKPENILVQGNTLKVGDLGLSKSIDEMTQTLTFKGSGTPRYMAPEIWERQKITPASDLYAIGVMLFEGATGQPPFDATDAADLREMHLYKAAPRAKALKADLPEHLDGIIRKLLEKNPSKRYQSAQEVIDALSTVPEEVSDTVAALRGKMRQNFDAVETQRLQEQHAAEQRAQAHKKIQYMEKQVIDEFDEVVATINKGLQETHISRSSTGAGSVSYSFGNRTLHVNFFKEGALSFNVAAPSLKEELKKHHAVHAGSVYIQQDRENREGWNLVLVQPPEEMYGEWILVESDMSALGSQALRYPPAATDQHLLVENIAYHWMHAMHTWVLKTKAFERSDVEKILTKFIP